MAKQDSGKKVKKEKFPYKFISPNRLNELRDKPTAELQKLFIEINKLKKRNQKAKKEDHKIADLKAEIKDHRTTSKEFEKERKQLEELKEDIKALREKIDEPIFDEKEDKKALEGGWRDAIKENQEELDVIVGILESRG